MPCPDAITTIDEHQVYKLVRRGLVKQVLHFFNQERPLLGLKALHPLQGIGDQ